MRVLVIGSGAREHALVRSLSADEAVESVIAAPGNPGMALHAHLEALPDLTDPAAVHDVARRLRLGPEDLVVVGPEAPLVAGVADVIRSAGIPVFGPSAAAARLEGSKAFAKDVMAAAGVPTARARVATTSDEAADALRAFAAPGVPYVVKDDGLAAGKGVVVTLDEEQALAHALACLAKSAADGGARGDVPGDVPSDAVGDAPGRVVIEEYLDGPEFSVFCVTDGTRVLALPEAQDFKRAGDGDTGPNTGGMGAYSPLDWLPAGAVDEVVTRVAQPTIDELRRRGTPFVGALYCGLAATSRGLRVVEFNARLGDPDGLVALARLRTPLGVLLRAAATGELGSIGRLDVDPRHAVTVVLAAQGYPERPVVGDPVTGTQDAGTEDAETQDAETQDAQTRYVLHAGTALAPDGELVSSGGRVLDVVALGDSLAQARERAYAGLSMIGLDGSHHRSDIAQAALEGRVHIPSRTDSSPPSVTP